MQNRRLPDVPPLFSVEKPDLPVSEKTTRWASTGKSAVASESYKHRFGFKQDSPRLLYGALNFIFQRDDIARLRASAID